MTDTPTTPAPMTAERLERSFQIIERFTDTTEVRRVREHIDALTTRIAELERHDADMKGARASYMTQRDDAVREIHRLQATLTAARKPVSDAEVEEEIQSALRTENVQAAKVFRRLAAELAAARKPPEDGEVAEAIAALNNMAFRVGSWGSVVAGVADLLTRQAAALKEAEEKFQCELRRANDYQDNLHRVGDQAKDLYARALAAETKLKTARRVLLTWLQEIARGRVGTMGAAGDVYVPQISKVHVDESIRALQQKDTVNEK